MMLTPLPHHPVVLIIHKASYYTGAQERERKGKITEDTNVSIERSRLQHEETRKILQYITRAISFSDGCYITQG
jgi:hypothetical protein